MGFKSIEEMLVKIKEYGRHFHEPVPENFNVHADYLINGLTERDFCSGYRAYQKIMQELQADMHARPEDYGLVSYDKKGNPTPAHKTMVNQYIWLFLALGQAGEIKDNNLIVDNNIFESFCTGKAKVGKNESCPKNNIDKLIARLSDHGFAESDEPSGFKLSADMPELLPVIKASSLSPYARISMTSDYPTFNYRMYSYGTDEKLPFDESYTYTKMTREMQEFSMRLINKLAENGWKSYIFFPHSTSGGRLTYPTLEYYYKQDSGFILIRNEKKTLELKDYMESLPEKYAQLWESATRCRACRKGECPGRITGEVFFGRKSALCGSSKAMYDCKLEDLEHIIEAALVTAGKIKIT